MTGGSRGHRYPTDEGCLLTVVKGLGAMLGLALIFAVPIVLLTLLGKLL